MNLNQQTRPSSVTSAMNAFTRHDESMLNFALPTKDTEMLRNQY